MSKYQLGVIQRYWLAMIALSLCATTQARDADPPPWAAAKLQPPAVPAVYLKEWRKAANRERCAPLVLADAATETGIKVRRANFYGGWAVAYDTSKQRSTFGIAGTGVDLSSDPQLYRFPNRLEWSDGSYAEYGPEAGIGPNTLAYLAVAGQSCLYNIWTKRGKAHLETLLASLRQVAAEKSE